jgi:hypothetical protein
VIDVPLSREDMERIAAGAGFLLPDEGREATRH